MATRLRVKRHVRSRQRSLLPSADCVRRRWSRSLAGWVETDSLVELPRVAFGTYPAGPPGHSKGRHQGSRWSGTSAAQPAEAATELAEQVLRVDAEVVEQVGVGLGSTWSGSWSCA